MNPVLQAAAAAAAAVAVAVLLAGCPATSKDCASPLLRCGGTCVDPTADATNCGACGNVCGAGTLCCGGACVDVHASDPLHCGACDRRCSVNGVCTAGDCSCPPAFPDECSGVCVDLLGGSAGNCGSCGWTCAAVGVRPVDAPCVAGACVCAGGPTATDCGNGGVGQCNNLLVDYWNCGACGHRCPATTVACTNGVCTCGAGRDWCGAACVSLAVDPANCGTCGSACAPATPTCSAGKCCPSGQQSCSGACVDTRSSPTNCGACGHACAAGESCCAGACVALATDAMNCGACGASCAAGSACSASSCACPPAQPTVCGAAPGTCCAGTACCGDGTCQASHANGLGQSYLDCGAQDAHTRDQANLAAEAWSATGSSVDPYLPCYPDCVCREGSGGAAVWCYGSSSALSGRVQVTPQGLCGGTAFCPSSASPTWH